MLRRDATLLTPLALFDPHIQRAYVRLGLCPTKYADLCWSEADDDNVAPTPPEMQHMGSLAWQSRALRRARRLLDLNEQVVTVAAARVMRTADTGGRDWLLKDGSLFQFDKKYLKQRCDQLRNVVACVKSHPVAFFGVEGERLLAELAIGQRSVAFLPRPISEARPEKGAPTTLATTRRPMVSWYLRVAPRNPLSANWLSGVVRLDTAATGGELDYIDEVSWAVLDEFYGLSARPDPRYDVMPYGIYDVEQYLKSAQLPGKLLLAELG